MISFSAPQLLSDPFLQLPTTNSVRVVWFTEFAGSDHKVAYGDNLTSSEAATTTKLSRVREDRDSRLGKSQKDRNKQLTKRDIWRHEAEVTGLTPNARVSYRVTSVREDGKAFSSGKYTLAPKPTPGAPLKILLTSDHQLKSMVAANLQKVIETVGRVDGVFMAGDLVNIPDRASEWFDDNRGGAFFPCLQGKANYELAKTVYKGGEIIQHAPIFTAIGNHEVMGRFGKSDSLGGEFDDAFPRQLAQLQAKQGKSDRTIADNSFNTDTYEEIFTLPESSSGGKTYYATTFGDVRLVVLYATNMWRSPNIDKDTRGKYQERQQDLNHPERWGHGQVIFGDIAKGTPQYNWLVQELKSSEFRKAKYKIVMLHHPPHSLGDNIVPAYTEPVPMVERNDGSIKAVRYEYPLEADYIIRDVMPLLEAAKVQLVFYGHSHLWNRFVSPSGMHFLETSNVGNSYGAAAKGNKQRQVPPGNNKDYVAIDDPNGLEPIVPTIAPLLDKDGQPTPYIASNDITIFSIFDTATGTVSSYRFDTREPKSKVVKFDEFKLNVMS